jgi:pimeloyl-ACP methyl ester carboxylesterase
MAYVESTGLRIFYRVVGEGSPIILHHGYTQSLKRWYLCGYVEALRREFQLIPMDPRGHGGSDKPHDPEAYALELRVGDVIAVMDTLGLEKVTFWGYSDGGRVGYALAKYFPERLTALIIGGHDPYERRIPPGARLFAAGNRESFLDMFLKGLNMDPAKMTPERRAELLANDFEALAAAQRDEPSLEDVLPTMKMPALFYAGEDDKFFAPLRQSLPLVPDATFFSLPGLNHPGAFWVSDQVVPHIRTFMARVLAGADGAAQTPTSASGAASGRGAVSSGGAGSIS